MTWALVAAAIAFVTAGGVIAAKVFPAPRPLRDRAVLGGLLGVALPIASVRLLSPFAAIAPGPLLAASIAIGAAALVLSGHAARRRAIQDLREESKLAVGALSRGSQATLAWVGLAALGFSAVAAWRYAPWAWDALGYHLPIVNDAVATHTIRTIPTSIPYINVYPRGVETFFVAVRTFLPDDTWIDFAQAPFGLLACVATAAFARRAGSPAVRAAAFGIALLGVPLVMLQLATDYVDVAVAAILACAVYFATNAELAPADLAAWAVATGLFLGCKPSAPPVVVLLTLFVLARAIATYGLARGGGAGLLAFAVVFAIGSETYLANVVAHGNPIWPIALHVGPLRLPGEDEAGPLFVQGLPPDLAQASWARRVLTSVFVEPHAYIYDMRLGGLGPLAAWGLVPLSVVSAVRWPRRALPAVLLAACALASPAAHWMRFALALPCALLALAAIAAPSAGWRMATDVALAGLAVIGVVRALPGLDAGRTGIDGREAQWTQVRSEIAPGEAFAYDASFSLPGQLACSDGRAAPPVYLGNARTADEVDRAITEGRVRVVLAGDSAVTRQAIDRAPDRYRLAFRCPLDECNVFVRRDRSP